MTLTPSQTVRSIVQENPAAVAVFESIGIDYCCGGNKSLEEACQKAKLSVEAVLANLEDARALPAIEEDCRWLISSLSQLTDHIVQQHHDYARRELPRLTGLASKVHTRHGHMYPELHQICELIEAMRSEMLTHMLKEEQVLFPRLSAMEQAAQNGTVLQPAFFGALINPIRHMMGDHDDTGELLKSIRTLTHNYKLPDEACMTYHALYQGLTDLEKDLHRHIHLENNILFPRALELEKAH
jgi:regulator of cell morphogenesis and NO signaling